MNRPPEPTSPRNIAYPEILEKALPNGLSVLVIPDYHLPRFSIRLAIPAGRTANPEHNHSLLQLALELLTEGTQSRTSRQIAEEMDHFAIQWESEVLMEYSLLSATVLEKYLTEALLLFADLILNPSFPSEELLKVKVRWKSSLISQRSQPGFLATERTFHTFFAEHPYSRVSIPLSHLEAADRESIQRVYHRCVVQQGAFLLFAGPIDLDQAVEVTNHHFGDWQSPSSETPPLPAPEYPSRRLVRLVHRPHSVQSRIVVSGPTPAHPDPALLLFRLANQVFGGGASSRLFLNLREDKGFTYGAYSMLRSYQQAGLFLAGADVGTDVTRRAIDETLAELQNTRESAPQAEEIERSQSEIIGAFLRQMETSFSVAGLELSRRMNRLPHDYYSRFIPSLRALGVNDVLESSRRYLDPANTVITVVGDRSQIEGDLRELGDTKVYDAEGNALDPLD